MADLCGNDEGIGGWDPGPCILRAGHGPDHTDGTVHWSTPSGHGSTAGGLHQLLVVEVEEWAEAKALGYQLGNLPEMLRAVVELHAPLGDPHYPDACSHCPADLGHPCATIQTIARELGIAAP